jgi:hypothetical protein
MLRRAPPIEMSLHRRPTNHCEPDEALFGSVRGDSVLGCPTTSRGLEHIASQAQDVVHFLSEVANPSVGVWEVLVEIDRLDHRVARDVRVERHRREGRVEIDVEVLHRLDLFQVLEIRVDKITAMRLVKRPCGLCPRKMREALLVSDAITQTPIDKDSHQSWIFIFQPPEPSQETRLDADLFQHLLESLAFCEKLVIESDRIMKLEDCDLGAHGCFCGVYRG